MSQHLIYTLACCPSNFPLQARVQPTLDNAQSAAACVAHFARFTQCVHSKLPKKAEAQEKSSGHPQRSRKGRNMKYPYATAMSTHDTRVYVDTQRCKNIHGNEMHCSATSRTLFPNRILHPHLDVHSHQFVCHTVTLPKRVKITFL